MYLNIGKGHFSVITRITNTTVYLADPDLGNINMTMANFTTVYSGYALVVTNDFSDPQLNGTALNSTLMQGLVGTSSYYYQTYYWAYYLKYEWVYIPTQTFTVSQYYATKYVVNVKQGSGLQENMDMFISAHTQQYTLDIQKQNMEVKY